MSEHLIRGALQLASDRVLVVPKTGEPNHYLFVFLSEEMNQKISLVEKGILSLQDKEFTEAYERFLEQCPADLSQHLEPGLLIKATHYRTAFQLDQLLHFLKELTPRVNYIPLQSEFPQVMKSLVLLTMLVEELNRFPIVQDTFPLNDVDVHSNMNSRNKAARAILKHFQNNRRDKIDIIIPICSWDHCAYLLLRRWNDKEFIVAICDGGEGRDVFFENATNQIPLVDSKSKPVRIHYHCVYVFRKDPVTVFKNSLRWFLRVIGLHWKHHEVFRQLYKCATTLCNGGMAVRLKGSTLYEGKSPYFPGQELFVVLQNIGNCAIHNLLLALRLCAGLYRVDRNRSRHEYSKLTFLLYYASYVAWIRNESGIEKFLLQHHSGDPQKGQLLLDSTYKPILLLMRKKFLKCGGSLNNLPPPFRFGYTEFRNKVVTSGADIDQDLLKSTWVSESAERMTRLVVPLLKTTLEVTTNTINNLQINVTEELQTLPTDSTQKDLNQAMKKKCDDLFIKVVDVYNDVDKLLTTINNNNSLVIPFDEEIITQKKMLEESVDDICKSTSDLTKNPFPDDS